MPIGFIKQVFSECGRDRVGQLSAAFAYVATFSIGPLLLVLISVIGLVFGAQAAQGQLFSHLSGAVGPQTAKTIQTVVANTHKSSSGGLALVLGTVGMLLGAAGLTTQLQNSFDLILRVVPDPAAGLKRTIYIKIKNILLIVLGGLAVAASVLVSALISGLGQRVQAQIGLPPLTLELLNTLVSLAVFVLILYLLYRVLPDVKIPSRIAFVGALVVSLLFLVGKIILGIIIGRNGTASAYGAAASLVTLLLWIYYSGQILFIGAEGIKVYGDNRALNYEPKSYNLRRQTINVDSSGLAGRLAEAFGRGLKKGKK